MHGGGKHDEMNAEDAERFELVRQVMDSGRAEIRNCDDDPVQSMAAVPVLGVDGAAAGALLVQAKRNATAFNEIDVKMMDWCTVYITLALDRIQFQGTPMETALRKEIPDVEQWTQFTTPESLVVPEEERSFWLSLGCVAPECGSDVRLFFLYFDSLALRQEYEIANDRLFNFCHTLIGAYRSPSDLSRAKRRGVFLCSSITNIGVDSMKPTYRIGLLLATLAFDLGADSVSHVWELPYTVLYGKGTYLQKHRCGLLLEILSSENCAILDGLPSSEIWEVVVGMVQTTHMGFYFDLLRNKTQEKRSIKLLSIATYVSDFARIPPEAEHLAALCDEFLKTADPRQWGLDPDLRTGQEVKIAQAVFVPILEEVSAIFPGMASLRQLVNASLRQQLDPGLTFGEGQQS
jgi:hypothetical protein